MFQYIFDPIISVIYNSKPGMFISHEARWLEHNVTASRLTDFTDILLYTSQTGCGA